MEKQPSNNQATLQLVSSLVLAGVALGLSYAAVSRAIDTGSWVEYAVAAVLLGLGIRNLLRANGVRKNK